MARYIPLSANRRLIIINHYPVYRLCVCARMRLSLSLSLRYASPRRPVVCAHLTYPREGKGRAYVLLRTFSRSPGPPPRHYRCYSAIGIYLQPSAMVISRGEIDPTRLFLPIHPPSFLSLFPQPLPRFFSTSPLRLPRSFSLINRWLDKYFRNRAPPTDNTSYCA